MRSSGRRVLWQAVLFWGLALGCGQARDTAPAVPPSPPSAGASSGGAPGAGAPGNAASGAPGPSSSGQGGSSLQSAGSGQGGSSGPLNPGGATSSGLPAPEDPLAAWPSAGCGRAPEQALGDFVRYQVQTSGTKAADATGNPGAWSYEREYFVSLPPQYEPATAYPLVIESPGCGGNGKSVYALKTEGGVIRVGLSPPPGTIDRNGFPGCFDVAEGDDSVEWPFYEAVMSELNARFCFDRHRVWAAGLSSGALLTNELACKYAGNRAGYGIRGVVTLGGLPTEPASVPTCSGMPLAGMWVGDTDNPTLPFEQVKLAVTRAIQLNACNGSTSYDDALYKDFPIPGRPPLACRQIMGCPEAYPVVVCPIPGFGRTSHDDFIVPGFDKLVQMLGVP